MQKILTLLGLLLLFFSCNKDTSEKYSLLVSPPENTSIPEGMVWIPGGEYYQGAVDGDHNALPHELPQHPVAVNGFFMDIHEVTNAQFAEFVKATGYITVAERPIIWEEMQKQLPPGTPKPADSLLQPGSLVFKKTVNTPPNLYDFSQWWEWKIGANWRHPNGPESNILGKENYPVVQISYEDAIAYCKWKGHTLPTEAQWEYAARAGKKDALYYWGDNKDALRQNANTWEGEFPVFNSQLDGFELRAPVMSYTKNDFGLYDMAGNVWEWTTDWYDPSYYATLPQNDVSLEPLGASRPNNPNNPYQPEKIIKGGSFLCNASYCGSYRISARMATSTDSGAEHTGFRTIKMVAAGK